MNNKPGIIAQKYYQLSVVTQLRPRPAYSLEPGLEVKYFIMLLCIIGIRQQQRTTAFTAMIPESNVHKRRDYIEISRKAMLGPFSFHCQSPVTVLCPSVRLLQKSSSMDLRSMSFRWKPGSLFHQSCQCAMSWEPCKQVINHSNFFQWLRT